MTSTRTPATLPASQASTGGKPPARHRNPRRRAREYAVQGIYEHLLNPGQRVELILAHLRENEHFCKADGPLCDALVRGATAAQETLDEVLAPHLDRAVAELSPVEHAVLLLGAWELLREPDTPFRVVINEGIELAKTFGGTDGHRFVNGVLDKLAQAARPFEATGQSSSGGA
ncbi:MAG: transcription antitermination factor NusB [Rhodocyclaceae bacterium]|nr:transcription antitermination factor NusB [Rhodocyclaceae bacterium]